MATSPPSPVRFDLTKRSAAFSTASFKSSAIAVSRRSSTLLVDGCAIGSALLLNPRPYSESQAKSELEPNPKCYRFESKFKELLSRLKLNTVCEEAQCPNICVCWNGGGDGITTTTIMLLGNTCTCGCRYCACRNPAPPDPMEPENTAEAIANWGVDCIVLTSVDRDDISDSGSGHSAQIVKVMKDYMYFLTTLKLLGVSNE